MSGRASPGPLLCSACSTSPEGEQGGAQTPLGGQAPSTRITTPATHRPDRSTGGSASVFLPLTPRGVVLTYHTAGGKARVALLSQDRPATLEWTLS